MTEAANIIVQSALTEMATKSGAAVGDILKVMQADPAGATAARFREYVAIGVAALASI